MPSIYLGRTSGSYSTQTFGGVTVTVSEQSYDKSNLFRKYKHQLRTPTGGNIWVFNKTWATYFLWDRYATLQPGEEYRSAKLERADVYVNAFDSGNTPLVLVLHFEGAGEQAESAANGSGESNGNHKPMYWKYSDFSSKINSSANMPLSSLTRFDESQLIDILIKENDETNKSLTYDLNEKGNGVGSSGTNYRDNKISVTHRQNVNGGTQAKFYKHIHSPKNAPMVRKSYVLYKSNVLMQSIDKPVGGIQGQQYSSITVYFSKEKDNPLLIELHGTKGPSTYLKRVIGGGDDKLFWVVDAKAASAIGKGDDEQVTKHLEQIVISLDNKIYVILNKQEPYGKSDLKGLKGLDGKTEFKLSKYQPSEIQVDGGQELKNGAEPDSQPIPYKKYTHTIKIDDKALEDVPQEVKSQAEFELIPSIPNVTIPMYEGGVGTGTKATLTFKQGTGLSTLSTNLHVYFYQHTGGDGTDSPPESPDNVPLMLEHNKTFYGPSGVSKYFTRWHKIDKITGDDTQNIAKELDRVNKALNEVNIDHDTKGEGESKYGISKPPGEDQLAGDFKTERVRVKCEKVGGSTGGACPSPPGLPGSNGCTPSPYTKYTHKTVNKYQLGKIKYKNVEVKVEGDGRNGTPITVKPEQNQLEVYYMTDDTNRNYPLLIKIGKQPGSGGGAGARQPVDDYYKLKTVGTGSASGYMWEQLGLDEKRGLTGGSGTNGKLIALLNKINYQVKRVLKLEIDKQGQYTLQLSKQPGKTDSGFTPVRTNGKSPNGNNQIQVEDCTGTTKTQCTALGHYKCFKHQLTNLGPEVLNQIGGIALTLPGKNGGEIVIPLYQGSDGTCENGDRPVEPLVYNSCMGDVYVFFYDGSSSGGGVNPAKVDTVPLMLLYGGKYYKPNSRDEYFEKWVCVSGIGGASQGKPCGGDNGVALVGALDEVNRALNVIELYDSSTKQGTSESYGLPTSSERGKDLDSSVGNERVKVTELKPKSLYAKDAYVKVVHRTKNGFEIGDIKHSGQEITKHGVNLGLGASIRIKNNGHDNHKSKVAGSGWNTVVAYYSTSDKTRVLPQLIVILKTDNEAGDGQDVKGARDTQYGYYILSTKNGGGSGGYEYKWVDVTDVGTQVTLDDETDFTLLNSVVILLDKQDKNGVTGNGYGDSEISAAVRTAITNRSTIKSPGQSDVNRINTNAKITVSDVTTKSAPTCSQYGYKVYQHDFGTMVAREHQLAKLPLSGVELILGVRLLIPCGTQGDTGEHGVKYRQLTLSESTGTSGPGAIDTHYLYYKGSHNQLYVYFYQGFDNGDSGNGKTRDQRPLLLCYNSKAYRPNGTGDYDSKWIQAPSISKCGCDSRGGDPILTALTQVVGFLNTVNLFNRPGGGGKCNGAESAVAGAPSPTTCPGSNGASCTYVVHKYQGKSINVRVTCKTIKSGDSATTTPDCYYMSMMHTPNGINGEPGGGGGGGPSSAGTTNGAQNGAPGYRLGQIIHKTDESKLDYPSLSSTNKWYPLVKVTTYYYSEDKNYEKPLLVVLEFKTKPSPSPGPDGTTVQEYYKLTPGDSMKLQWEDDTSNANRKLGTGDGSTEGPVDNAKLISYLDEIRFGLMKVVQIEIHQNRGTSYKLKGGSSTQGTNKYTQINGEKRLRSRSAKAPGAPP